MKIGRQEGERVTELLDNTDKQSINLQNDNKKWSYRKNPGTGTRFQTVGGYITSTKKTINNQMKLSGTPQVRPVEFNRKLEQQSNTMKTCISTVSSQRGMKSRDSNEYHLLSILTGNK
ncbi:hypothetical protein RUM44_012235 [Polyplax serrata]|uniref:Uncharacterized protein n=1 Tax=Polyplax serrata TaxID=468196 RepID=A0ABR1BES7_POLSC